MEARNTSAFTQDLQAHAVIVPEKDYEYFISSLAQFYMFTLCTLYTWKK
jgi:hypothetical protein